MLVESQRMETYQSWNTRALRHFFLSGSNISVFDLDVSDESLARIAKGSLVGSVRNFFRDHNHAEIERTWKFQAQLSRRPDYFAFLLASCRVEWLRDGGQFESEFRRALAVNSQPWLDLLPKLWQGLVQFLANDPTSDWNELVLPEHYESFSRIGHTVGLVFPRRADRNKLCAMFGSLDLNQA